MLTGSRNATALLAMGACLLHWAPIAFAQSTPKRAHRAHAVQQTTDTLSSYDWTSIRAAYEAERHATHAAGSGFRAHNPGQRWHSHFDGRGVSTTPDRGGWTWGLQLEAYGFEGQMLSVSEPLDVTATGGRVTYEWDASLDEWYVNDRRGLEHGYTLRERPACSPAGDEQTLQFELGVRGGLRPEVITDGRGVDFSDPAGATVLTYTGLVVIDAEETQLEANFTVRDGRLVLSIDEREAAYPLTIDPIAQQAYIKASNNDDFDNFGWKVAASGNTAVVGAPWEDSAATGVNGNQFQDSALNSGAAYVFVRSGSSWIQEAYLKASNSDAFDLFGTYLSIDGDTIAIGAPDEDSASIGVNGDQSSNSATNSGAVYVFVRNGSTWSQQAYIKASNTGSADSFAQASVSGDLLAVCADGEDSNATGVNNNQVNNSATNAGAAYVFVRTGSSWAQEAYLKASNTNAGDAFGVNALSGQTLVVGAPGEDGVGAGINPPENTNGAFESGAAYVFERSGTTWSQSTYIKASNSAAGDSYGLSLAISGDTFVVGANGEDSNATGVNENQLNNGATNSGAVYAYARAGASWVQEAYIKPLVSGPGDQFGYAVALSDTTLIVGAWEEDSSATGIDGNSLDNSATASGAAYHFHHFLGMWQQLAYIKASNTDAGDDFGLSVGVGDGFAVIGAPNEDSTSSGIDGSQGNGGSGGNGRSGAAYVIDFSDLDNGSPTCSGDGTAGQCPCFNFGNLGAGCENSVSFGARLEGSGLPISAVDSFTLGVTDSTPGTPGLIFQGSALLSGGFGNPLGNGLLCVSPQKRWEVKFADANGSVLYGPSLFGSHPAAVPSAVLHYQWWYRDVADSCGGGFNFSNAWTVTWL